MAEKPGFFVRPGRKPECLFSHDAAQMVFLDANLNAYFEKDQSNVSNRPVLSLSKFH